MQEILIKNKIALSINEIRRHRETVIFLHGLAGSSSAWKQCVENLGIDFNIVLLDLRGHGKSHRYKKYSDYELSNFSEDMNFIFSELGLQQATLVSHSFGCFIAMEYISAHPNRIKKAIFISQKFNTRSRVLYLFLTGIAWIGPVVDTLFLRPSEPFRLDYKNFPENTDFNPRRLCSDIANTGLRTYIHCLRRILYSNHEEKLAKAKCPVLLIHGDSDRVFPFKNAILAKRKIPHARVVCVPKANHVVLLTHANFLCRQIEKFISTHEQHEKC